jgi:hypothetical protein
MVDVYALLSYDPSWKEFLAIQIDGRAPLEVDGMTNRMEEVIDRAVRQLCDPPHPPEGRRRRPCVMAAHAARKASRKANCYTMVAPIVRA